MIGTMDVASRRELDLRAVRDGDDDVWKDFGLYVKSSSVNFPK